jgi:predicted PhzF superfamily epimerase YddE/YHI9
VADFQPEVGRVSARIFTAEEELPFAGHPVIGAAAALHRLPMQVASTGLTYLIVPVTHGLDRAQIAVRDFEERLASVGAKFVYVFDPDKLEGRSWDNTGALEDVATGTAAGPAAGFLAAHGLAAQDETILINQGRLLGRPSVIAVTPDRLGRRTSCACRPRRPEPAAGLIGHTTDRAAGAAVR